jgi:hypothetical protein
MIFVFFAMFRLTFLASVVVYDLNGTRIGIDPAETDSPLFIDSNAVLASPVSGESF